MKIVDYPSSVKKYYYRRYLHIRGVAVVVSVTVVPSIVRPVIAATGRLPHTCPNNQQKKNLITHTM